MSKIVTHPSQCIDSCIYYIYYIYLNQLAESEPDRWVLYPNEVRSGFILIDLENPDIHYRFGKPDEYQISKIYKVNQVWQKI